MDPFPRCGVVSIGVGVGVSADREVRLSPVSTGYSSGGCRRETSATPALLCGSGSRFTVRSILRIKGYYRPREKHYAVSGVGDVAMF